MEPDGGTFSDLLDANRAHASRFAKGQMGARVRRGLGVVSCMDTRIDPLSILGLEIGDAKILRNAGGRVTPDVLRSLHLAISLLGVERVLVLHHSGCALAERSDDQVRALLRENAAAVPSWPLYAMPDPDEALKSDVAALRSAPMLPRGLRIEGWRYDVESGRVVVIVPERDD